MNTLGTPKSFQNWSDYEHQSKSTEVRRYKIVTIKERNKRSSYGYITDLFNLLITKI